MTYELTKEARGQLQEIISSHNGTGATRNRFITDALQKYSAEGVMPSTLDKNLHSMRSAGEALWVLPVGRGQPDNIVMGTHDRKVVVLGFIENDKKHPQQPNFSSQEFQDQLSALAKELTQYKRTHRPADKKHTDAVPEPQTALTRAERKRAQQLARLLGEVVQEPRRR